MSETLAGRGGFLDLLLTDAVGVVMLDVSWCGGLSEARKKGAKVPPRKGTRKGSKKKAAKKR